MAVLCLTRPTSVTWSHYTYRSAKCDYSGEPANAQSCQFLGCSYNEVGRLRRLGASSTRQLHMSSNGRHPGLTHITTLQKALETVATPMHV